MGRCMDGGVVLEGWIAGDGERPFVEGGETIHPNNINNKNKYNGPRRG